MIRSLARKIVEPTGHVHKVVAPGPTYFGSRVKVHPSTLRPFLAGRSVEANDGASKLTDAGMRLEE